LDLFFYLSHTYRIDPYAQLEMLLPEMSPFWQSTVGARHAVSLSNNSIPFIHALLI